MINSNILFSVNPHSIFASEEQFNVCFRTVAIQYKLNSTDLIDQLHELKTHQVDERVFGLRMTDQLIEFGLFDKDEVYKDLDQIAADLVTSYMMSEIYR